MILVDTSVWIDHLRAANAALAVALSESRVVQHPYVTAELALGSLAERQKFVTMLSCLPQAARMVEEDFLDFVTERKLHGTGLGMVDAHLLASVVGHKGVRLWTLDRRLAEQAERMGLAYH